MDEDRIKHSLAVARKMVKIAKKYNMSEQDVKNCFVIGIILGMNFQKIKVNIIKLAGKF